MAQLIFAFTVNPEAKEMTSTGNMEPQAALRWLQQLVIADAVKKATEAAKAIEPTAETKEVKKDEPDRV